MGTLGSNKGKLLIPIIAGVLVVAIVCGVLLISKKASAKKRAKPAIVQVVKTLVPLSEMVVNLADTGEPHYLKATVVLEVHGGGEKSEIDDAMPKIRDAVIASMSTCCFHELLSYGGKSALKNAIKKKLNAALHATKVDGVYFSDFAMQ